MTRTNYAAAMDAVRKLQEIAARTLGGSPSDYDIGNETVFRRSDRSRRMTYAGAARRAMELGGEYSGHEMPDDLNRMTNRSPARTMLRQALRDGAGDRAGGLSFEAGQPQMSHSGKMIAEYKLVTLQKTSPSFATSHSTSSKPSKEQRWASRTKGCAQPGTTTFS